MQYHQQSGRFTKLQRLSPSSDFSVFDGNKRMKSCEGEIKNEFNGRSAALPKSNLMD
jgi:hypothetical protein